jgi:hypothetical protein
MLSDDRYAAPQKVPASQAPECAVTLTTWSLAQPSGQAIGPRGAERHERGRPGQAFGFGNSARGWA